MIRIRRLCLILFMCAMFMARPQSLPADGESIGLLDLEFRMPDNFSDEKVLDFSEARVFDKRMLKFRSYGDSIITCTDGRGRSFFLIRNDTIWSMGGNDSGSSAFLTNGVPYLTDIYKEIAYDSTDKLTYNIYDYTEASIDAVMSYSISPGASIRVSKDEPLWETTCVRTTLECEGAHTEYYRWYVPGYVWPIAEYTIYKDGFSHETLVSICPVSLQEHVQGIKMAWEHRLKPVFRADDDGNWPEPGNCRPFRINMDGNTVSVSMSGDASGENGNQAVGVLHSSVYDGLGRLWHESYGDTTISLSKLSQGYYILEVTCGDFKETIKISLNRNIN